MRLKKVFFVLIVVIVIMFVALIYCFPSSSHTEYLKEDLSLHKLKSVSQILPDEYIAMKYGQRQQPQRLMDMSLTVAESGALALRRSHEAKDSLDFRLLQHRRLVQEAGGALHGSGGKREAASTAGTGNITALKHILYLNKYSHFNNFNFGAGKEAFVRHGCAVSSCTTTEDRSLVPEDRVDAIVFSLGLNQFQNLVVPTLPRYPNARRVVFGRECPARLQKSLQMYDNIFDYTVTYRYDSDARSGYGRVVAVEEPPITDIVTANYANGKSRLAAWFVSNCDYVTSRRELLASSLQQHGVSLDVYGACGHFKCSSRKKKQCLEMVEKKYKFYFAFENSLCNQYVTEKFFKILEYNVVPVTYGLGHEFTGVPKDAYVDVFDFPDVKSLAQYLLYLDSNDTAYNEYFRWKRHFKATWHKPKEHPFCQLCADLHAYPPPPQRKYDLQAWFSEGQCVNVLSSPRLRLFLGLSNNEQ